MGRFTDAECSQCGQPIKDGERVLVSLSTKGTFNDGEVEYDMYDEEEDIRHAESCPEDILFEIPVDYQKCPSCNWLQTSLFALAYDRKGAELVIADGGGLCAQCMCQNIIDTHGAVKTQKAHINS